MSIKHVADVALLSGDRVLLVRYRDVRRYDGQRGWFLPDDYLRRFEHPMDAGARILRDQLGVDGVQLDLGFIESFDSGGNWHLVFHLTAGMPDGAEAMALRNVAALQWFARDTLPPRSEMAHEGWAADVLDALALSRTEAIQIRSVAE